MTNLIKRLQKGQEGFTLIELLVVVAIIALLATFAVPKLFDAINKSKKAPGDADMGVISSALERYYFESTANAYPTDAAAATIMNDLKGGFVKSNTTFVNGFNRGYLYITNTAGNYYILVDPRGNTGTVQAQCGNATTTLWTSTDLTIGNAFVVSQQAGPTSAQMNAGCRLMAGATTLEATVVTN